MSARINTKRRGPLAFISLMALLIVAGSGQTWAAQNSAQAGVSAPRIMPAESVPVQVQNGTAQLIGKHADDATLNLLFMLPIRDPAGLEAFIADVGDPDSPNYGRYLTLDEANARFNPDITHEQSVVSWLRSGGITNVVTTPNHLYVKASGATSSFSALLNVQFNDYMLDGRRIYSVNQPPVLPAQVSGDISWITNLSSVATYRTMISKGTLASRTPIPAGSEAQKISPLNNGNAHGQAPYYPQDLANAYDVNPLWNGGFKGNGTTVAITLWGAAPSDLSLDTWAGDTAAAVATRANGRLAIIPIDGGSTIGDPTEASLDILASGGMAYQAQIRFYQARTDRNGDPDTAGLVDALNAAGTDTVANRQITNSWSGDENSEGINSFEPVLQSNSATGHNYIFSSGDAGSASPFTGRDPYPGYPSSSPYVTSVGGTRFVANVGTTWPGERSWDYIPASGGYAPQGSGGGFSLRFGRPTWQVAAGFNNPKRGYPDVAVLADPGGPGDPQGFYVCTDYQGGIGCGDVGGTSLSAPLWAGMMAITNQYIVANNRPALGFANPRLYKLATDPQSYAPLHDTMQGTNGAYATGGGWDAVTGLGSPDLMNIARDLNTFSDVSTGNTFYPYIECLTSRYIISGYADNTFRPNNNVTRGQLSKIVSNSANFTDDAGAQLFQDVPAGSTYFDYVQRLAHRGIMGGYPCGGAGEPCGAGNKPYFRVNNNATRGQSSKVVANTFFPGCNAGIGP